MGMNGLRRMLGRALKCFGSVTVKNERKGNFESEFKESVTKAHSRTPPHVDGEINLVIGHKTQTELPGNLQCHITR